MSNDIRGSLGSISEEMKAEKDRMADLLRHFNFAYDDLLNFCASTMAQAKKMNEDWNNLANELSHAATVHAYAEMLDDPKFSKDGVMKIITEIASMENEMRSNPAQSILQLIASMETAEKSRIRVKSASGGEGRAAKFRLLEAETIRMFEAGSWRTAPAAAVDITPVIVELSKKGNGNLLPSTTKPLAWIRAHIKKQKTSGS